MDFDRNKNVACIKYHFVNAGFPTIRPEIIYIKYDDIKEIVKYEYYVTEEGHNYLRNIYNLTKTTTFEKDSNHYRVILNDAGNKEAIDLISDTPEIRKYISYRLIKV